MLERVTVHTKPVHCALEISFNNNGKKLLDICQQANIISNDFHTLQAHDGLGDTL